MVPAPSDATATMPLSQDEQNSSIIQQGVKPKELHSGNVVLLDGRKLDFQVSKNAEGEILFNLVTDAIGLIEKDYFSLAFYENGSVRKWLYKNKKIQKQVKDLPWDFSLEVKFYTPDPSQLADDFTRHLLTLQLRTDIYNGKLPASLVNQAHLGSLIAQAELGDYSPEKTYGQSLRALNIVPNMSDELESKIIQLYKDQKGKTPPEAELSFLMACRELTLYGMVMFSAKHNGKPVRVGINSAGISVFQEHLRQNYVVWQGMHQLEYQRKSFTIKLKHGEKEGKSSLTFKLDTEPLAKLCWRTAVEHHTFFRLMQPEDKTNKGGFFQLGSGRFRPEGRTHFQTKMASQMFDGTPTAGPQISSAQIVSRSSENLPAANQGSSPVHYADDKSMEGSSPQKRYTITSHMETNSPRTSTLDRSLEVGTVSDSGIENAKSLDSPLYVSTTTQVTAKTTTIPRFGRYTVTETPSPRFLRAEETLPPPTQPEVWPDENVRPGRPTVSTPTLLSAQWFSRQRHPPPLITRTHASATRNSPPTPSRTSISVPPKFLSQHFSSEKRDTVTESSRYTTKIPARSLSAAPYAQLIAMSPNGDQMLPIVRELNESVHTTLMNLPYRSHTVLAEYISSPASSQISTELLSTYRSLLSSAGHSPEEIDYRVKEATISRVYCRRSHLSPKTPYSPLPANAEEAIRTRTPSPNVQFDDTINHCVRIIGMDNTVPLYQYNVSAAEAQRAVQRGAISPSRKQYQSLTREEQVIETPKSRFSFPRRKKHIPRRNIFERNEFQPVVAISRTKELPQAPVRYFSDVYHSGYNLQDRKVIRRKIHEGDESEGSISDLRNYGFSKENAGQVNRLEKSGDLDSCNIREHVLKRSYPKSKGMSRFPKPVAVLHLQRQRRPSHGHTNGFAQVDLSPIPIPPSRLTPQYPEKSGVYTGKLEPLRHSEIVSKPLRSDVSVYHSGQSEPSRNRRFKFFTWARHEGEEEVGDKDPTGYKFDHSPYEGPLDDVNKVNDLDTLPLASYVTKYHEGKTVLKEDEEEIEEPHDKQTAIIHLRSKEDEPQVEEELKPAKAPKQPKEKKPKKEKKDKDQESSFFGFLKSKDRKAHEEVGHVSTPSTSSYPLIGERYEGPLDEVDKQRELDSQPLRSDVSVYHSGQSETAREIPMLFACAMQPKGGFSRNGRLDYGFNRDSYDGPLDNMCTISDLETVPLSGFVTKYHEGESLEKGRKERRPISKPLLTTSTESDEEKGPKQTAIIHVLNGDTAVPDKLRSRTKGQMDTDRQKDYELKIRSVLRNRKPAESNYPLKEEAFDGPLEGLQTETELPTVDIFEYSSPYHHGQSSIKASHKGMAILHLKRLEDELKQPSKSVHQEAQVWDANINGTADRLGLFSLFNRKRKAEDRHWLRTLVRARRGEKSDEFSGIVFKDRSLFNKSDPITDLDIDIVLRRQFEASYEVEILLRDKKTSRFEALFSRRGPVFLPKSLLDDDNASAELRVREVGNKRSGRGVGAGEAFNSGGPQGTRGNDDSDEADESSLASQPHSSNGAAAKRYRHRRAEPTDRPQKLPMAANKATKNGTRVSLLSSLRRQISQFSSKDKKSNKSSKQVSASSSSSDSEVEVEERHAVQNEKSLLSTLTSCVQKNEELPRVRLIARKLEIEQQESGPMYQKASPAKSFAWPNVRELRRYFSHMKVIDGASSLSRRLRRSHRSVYKCESETAPPHTTLQSWHETETSPEQIVTEIDEHGNVIKKTIKTSHETHTIQKQTYQTFSVGNDANEPNGTSNSIENALETIQSINSSIPTAASHAQTRVLVYGKDGEQLETSDVQYDENQVVSSKVVTTGNRTIETITYKTVKDGVVSTNVEHRVTIQGPEVDHEAELRKAIIEATGLNPRYEVQRVEVKQERLA
uniref:FERM domain-containing protein n=1 Tax=Bursaphelenchus xylophilus TaxID=6326 RepID=A0A1I7RL67_BURXY